MRENADERAYLRNGGGIRRNRRRGLLLPLLRLLKTRRGLLLPLLLLLSLLSTRRGLLLPLLIILLLLHISRRMELSSSAQKKRSIQRMKIFLLLLLRLLRTRRGLLLPLLIILLLPLLYPLTLSRRMELKT